MAYRVILDGVAEDDVRVLPAPAQPAFTEVLVVLEEVPWNGHPINKINPDGAVRQFVFGPHAEGLVTYLVLERERRVDVISVTWIG